MPHKKIALVVDWLINPGGAERVVLALHQMFPEAPIFAPIYDPQKATAFQDAEVRTSFLQKFPLAQKIYPKLLPLMPYAVESFDLSDFDLVISSSSSGCSKGIITKPATRHICYCHTPMRAAWDDFHEYQKTFGASFLSWPMRKIIPAVMHKIRLWDYLASVRVDEFIANSEFVRQRIRKYYRREAQVIYPPVEVDRFTVSKKAGEYFLAIGRLVPYKRFDLIVEAFNILKLPLKIVGVGKDLKNLKRRANSNIEFLGFVEERDLPEIYACAQGLIFPQAEDFGIVAVEAQAAGRPVVALRAGGALETVRENTTGIFFDEQSVESLVLAVRQCVEKKWDAGKIRRNAERFSVQEFKKRIGKLLSSGIAVTP
jgi:glycosyltransferase involved in cell wall biosynthesis